MTNINQYAASVKMSKNSLGCIRRVLRNGLEAGLEMGGYQKTNRLTSSELKPIKAANHLNNDILMLSIGNKKLSIWK